MKIDYPHAVIRRDEPEGLHTKSILGVYDTDTGEIAEHVELADLSYDIAYGTTDLTDIIAKLQQIVDENADRFNEGIVLTNEHDLEDVGHLIVGRRTMRPGDRDYPATITPYLDDLYPARTWEQTQTPVDPDGLGLDRMVILSDLVDELKIEQYLQRNWVWTTQTHRQFHLETAQRLVSVRREAVRFGVNPDDATIRFFTRENQPVLFAEVTTGEGVMWWRWSVPPTSSAAVDNLEWFVQALTQ